MRTREDSAGRPVHLASLWRWSLSVLGTFAGCAQFGRRRCRPGGRWLAAAPGRGPPCTSLQSVNWDWASIASLATAIGTLVLAVATFASVRSANRAARAAEQSLLVGLRPLRMPSRLQDETQKVNFGDGKWIHVPGGRATVLADNGVIYLTMSLRNVGRGIAVVHGWHFYPSWGADLPDPVLDEFHRQNRDIYLPPGDVGFWQAAFRDQADPQYEDACKAVTAREQMTVDVLYGDHDGGQRVVTRFLLQPRQDEDWMVSAGRHWNVDRPEPR